MPEILKKQNLPMQFPNATCCILKESIELKYLVLVIDVQHKRSLAYASTMNLLADKAQ